MNSRMNHDLITEGHSAAWKRVKTPSPWAKMPVAFRSAGGKAVRPLAVVMLLLLAAGCGGKGGGLVVNSAGDAGDSDPGDEVCRTAASATECTLRAAIEEANAWAGSDTITFNLPAGSLTISPASSLPSITESVILDATSQPGYVRGSVMVTLNGDALAVPPTIDGLTVAAPDLAVTLKGFAIVEFPDNGISNRGRLTLEEMQVSRNVGAGLASGGGAAIPVIITNSEFSENGSAGISSTMNDFTITGGIIRGNGGGIGVSAGSLVMNGTEVRDNTGSALTPFGGIGLFNSRAELTDVIVDGNNSHDSGGGIDFTSDGSHVLIVTESRISNNIAFVGGGIAANGGTVRLNHSVLLDNKARIDGGGVWLLAGSSGTAALWVENGTVIGEPGHGNVSEFDAGDGVFGRGGGIYSEARVEISNSVVEANSGDGIVNNNGWLRLQGGTVRGNTMNGIWSSSGPSLGTIQISGSTIENNTLTGINAQYADLFLIGSLIRNNSEGGLQMDNGELDLSYSTISGNSHVTDGRAGGGIGLRSMDSVAISNSVIYDNYAFSNGGGLYIQADSGMVKNVTISGNRSGNTGGGMVAAGSNITLNNVTITQNRARFSGGILGIPGLTITNTIIAENTPINCAYPDPVASGGYNLDDGTTCAFTAAGDLSEVSPMLGPLQDNGGTTLTHALLPGSPAIDAGNDAACLALDQRNVVRPQGPHCDIGAFELIPADATPTPTHTPYPTPATETPTPTTGVVPTATQTPAPIVFESVEFSSDKLFQGGQSCDPKMLTVKVRVTPPEQVSSVGLFYRVVEKNGNGKYDWSEGLAMTPAGNGWYALTLVGNELPDIFIWQNEAWLDFQFVANGPNNQPIAWSTVYRQVTFWQCYV